MAAGFFVFNYLVFWHYISPIIFWLSLCEFRTYIGQSSALKPNNVFFKGDATNSILIRLDDKIGRIKSNTEEKPRTNDVADIIGYCVLLLISMGVSAEEIAKFKD